jgi:RHS repeat-associated protein
MKFTGEHLDPTGLYHLRARQYDPGTGRFLGRDPVPADVRLPSVSTYAYVGNQPTVFVDPTGECPVCGIIVGGVGSAGVYAGGVLLTDEEFSWRGLAAATAGGAAAGGGGSAAFNVARRLITSSIGRRAATAAGTFGAAGLGSEVSSAICGEELVSPQLAAAAGASTRGSVAGESLLPQRGFRVRTVRGLFRAQPNTRRIWGATYVGGLAELGYAATVSDQSISCK